MMIRMMLIVTQIARYDLLQESFGKSPLVISHYWRVPKMSLEVGAVVD